MFSERFTSERIERLDEESKTRLLLEAIDEIRHLRANEKKLVAGVTSPETLAKLQDFGQSFCKRHSFSVGQLIQWKSGLKNRRRPLMGEPAIVLGILDEPVFDQEEKSAGSTYFREPLDILLGTLDEDGDFLTFYFDSRRFEPHS